MHGSCGRLLNLPPKLRRPPDGPKLGANPSNAGSEPTQSDRAPSKLRIPTPDSLVLGDQFLREVLWSGRGTERAETPRG